MLVNYTSIRVKQMERYYMDLLIERTNGNILANAGPWLWAP
jgi:hypothetical protein